MRLTALLPKCVLIISSEKLKLLSGTLQNLPQRNPALLLDKDQRRPQIRDRVGDYRKRNVLMNCRRIRSWFVLATFALARLQFGALAQTNVQQTVSAITIKTNFVTGAELSAFEVKQVLELAKVCGIDSPAELSTFQYLPAGGRGISVKSEHHVDGRNTSFDTIIISKTGWDYRKAEKGAKKIGNFWANADERYSTLLRRFEFKNDTIQIRIGHGVDIAFADKVIPLIIARKVRFENDSIREEFDELKNAKPVTISPRHPGKGYELLFEVNELSMRGLIFEWKDGHIVITGISRIVI